MKYCGLFLKTLFMNEPKDSLKLLHSGGDLLPALCACHNNVIILFEGCSLFFPAATQSRTFNTEAIFSFMTKTLTSEFIKDVYLQLILRKLD